MVCLGCGPAPPLDASRLQQVLTASWRSYVQHYISPEGRVVIPERAGGTISEAQAYALLRAVWAGDEAAFFRVYRWTRQNLSRAATHGDALLAWHWGRRPDGSWGVLDWHSAADGDLDYALALALAARRGWRPPPPLPDYLTEARHVAQAILALEVVALPGTEWGGNRGGEERRGTRPSPNLRLVAQASRLCSAELHCHSLKENWAADYHRKFPTPTNSDSNFFIITAEGGCSTFLPQFVFLSPFAFRLSPSPAQASSGRLLLTPGNWHEGHPPYLVNPSYFSPAAYRALAAICPDPRWEALHTHTYQLLEKIGEGLEDKIGVGLFPDWCRVDARGRPAPAPGRDTHFGWEAVRLPWRLALDGLWFQESQAAALLNRRFLPFFKKEWQTRGKLLAVYQYDGTPAVDYESPVMYAGVLAGALAAGDRDFAGLMAQKILSFYRAEGNQAYFVSPDNYYAHNWAWLGLWLFSEAKSTSY